MINQINLFTNPKSDAEIRFVKLDDNSIAPIQDEAGNWIMFASEDILLRSNKADQLYCGLSMFIDDVCKFQMVHLKTIILKYLKIVF